MSLQQNAPSATQPILSIRDLHICTHGRDIPVDLVRGLSLDIAHGETLALVGESGCGKSMTALSVLRLLPPGVRIRSGSIHLKGQDLAGANDARLREIRGNRVGMIFQEPMNSLNPLHTIGRQIAESLHIHQTIRRNAIRSRVIELLDMVGLPNPQSRLRAFPHELSGGQRQRVMIAMALANAPDLLIADEPTTALDVTIQAQILSLLKDMQKQLGMAILFITHDLGIVRRIADRACVMKDGELVEERPTPDLFSTPQHPFTRHLLSSGPSGHKDPVAPDAPVVLDVQNMQVRFPLRHGLFGLARHWNTVVNDVSLTLRQGQTLGIVGESGSGKTTLAMAILRLVKAQGRIVCLGHALDGLPEKALRPFRRSMQIVFQDPWGSLSPRMTVRDIIGEGLDIHCPGNKQDREAAIQAILDEVGLTPDHADRYPHEFSGGQRQRIGIARALVLKPRLLVLDEPTSALDVSIQAQIIALLRNLQQRHHLSCLFISHDLRAVRALADTILVMKNGQAVEYGPTSTVLKDPQHPYTQTLLAAAFLDQTPGYGKNNIRFPEPDNIIGES
ncbi:MULTISPECIES: ABC transporter ATP-binding protein [unclassified Haematospirillum]|uniref:ABC transporter ATP-binding protein n=1 Tax=unclassified Haematospirillum TaxID=2622088 RepID=UPI00143A0D43|nr:MULTISPECIES: ABC transporter ATP-binding protein [unclassified Haematospirillum]NKD55093.1 ABC transporter ATP-binding protein [Haematospirillum sp. H4890]NKD75346.1 ABC transporter ATP-binding protein [Haematospirillum sp. H4485]